MEGQTFQEWVGAHRQNPGELRLGQRFVNEYQMEELGLYFLDDQTASAVIERMLRDLHYWPNMPNLPKATPEPDPMEEDWGETPNVPAKAKTVGRRR